MNYQNQQMMTQANELDQVLKNARKVAALAGQYKLDDIYVLEYWDRFAPQNTHVETSSMGVPNKYKVVYVSSEGVPFLQKLTSAGKTMGDTFLPPELQVLDYIRKHYAMSCAPDDDEINCRLIPDPEQMNAILLQQEFDPVAVHREKVNLFREIQKHNKAALIRTDCTGQNEVAKFFKSCSPGDKFWTGSDKQYVIQSIVKKGREWVITAVDQNQATVVFNFSSFNYKRLYKKQPRSFAKESKI